MDLRNQDRMAISRRDAIKGLALSGCLAAGGDLQSLAAAVEKSQGGDKHNSYKYRIAFGAWINDMRNEPLPLQDWPAPQMDEETIRSAIAAMDVQAEAGFNYLDAWGLFATKSYPPDIVSVFNDKIRRKRVNELIEAGKKREIKLLFGLGLMSWGYDEIIKSDPEVRDPASEHPHAMCGNKDKAWNYVKKIIDCALSEYDFCGVHLESADQGWCQCPACGGRDGTVGYNVRLNIRAADYIKSKWPDKLVTVIPINWLNGTGRRWFNEDDKARLIELSKHIDCFMDLGWRGTYIADNERKDFMKKLHCAYGTAGGAHLYHSVRWDRSTYFLPYIRRSGNTIKQHYEEGARACMLYQGPVSNPATEINIAVGGRMLSDAKRNPEDVLAEAIEFYYKPKTQAAHKKLVDIFLRAEDTYCNGWDAKAFAAGRDPNSPWCGMPGEFYLNEKLYGKSPGPAGYLIEPYLNAAGRKAYREGLVSILKELPVIKGSFDDTGRIAKIRRAVIVTLNLINTICQCKGESWE
ncbi:MAG: hypothetical protein JXM70_07885 [Pirellulales bacterium]|nr:hypothetical protein [Pirellulales bacterium]